MDSSSYENTCIDPSSLLSETLIVAVKGKGFALLGSDSLVSIGDLKWPFLTNENKSFKVSDNVYMAGSGHMYCGTDLEISLKKKPYPSRVKSMLELVSFVKDRINDEFCEVWNAKNQSISFLVVGNLPGRKTYRFFEIQKYGTSTTYGCEELGGDTVALGSGYTKDIKAFLDQFKKTDDVETATRLVFDVLRLSTLTCSGVGGDLRVITLREGFAIMSEVEQEDRFDCTSPYTTRTDTIMDPKASHQISVTYRIN